jgi:MarR family 2-MHQ and catechol resistance regulon transcriptional repressor
LVGKKGVLAWLYLAKVYGLISKMSEREFRQYGLTTAKFDIIAHLGIAPEGLNQCDLARRLLVSRGNISGVIDRMEKDGLIIREREKDDRRYYRVKLSEKGKKIFRRVVPEHEENIEKLFSVLTEEEKRELKSLLGKLFRSLREKNKVGGEKNGKCTYSF